jgi:hypothetical protein
MFTEAYINYTTQIIINHWDQLMARCLHAVEAASDGPADNPYGSL